MSDITATGPNLADFGEKQSVNRTGQTGLLPILLLLGVWLAVSLALLGRGYEDISNGNLLGNDDAMRLVEVRDYMAGQSWFDNLQRRLSPPDGVMMHWSRLVDAPIAAMISGFEMFTDRSLAERFAMSLWPLILLLAAMGTAASLGSKIGGRKAMIAAIIIAPTTMVALTQFMPGRIDHHNLQIVLTMLLLALAVHMRERPVAAAIAGSVIAVMLAIGLETLSYMMLAPMILTLCWVATGPALARTMIFLGMSLAVSVIGVFVATIPREQFGAVQCDVLALPHVMVFALGGLGLAAMGLASRETLFASRPTRFVLASIVGGAIGSFAFYSFPQCLSGPYGDVDPRLVDLWLSNVSEAQSVFDLAAKSPDQVLANFGFPVAALIIGIYAWFHGNADTRFNWLFINGFVLVGIAVACWQIRGITFANMLAIPASAWMLSRIYRRMSGEKNPARRFLRVLVAGLVLNNCFYIGAADALSFMKPDIVADTGAAKTCVSPATLSSLQSLPPGVILSFIDLGPHILAHTSHSVVAAPYHRNMRGNLLAIDVLMASPDHARGLVDASEVDYILYCEGMTEARDYAAHAPEGLLARLQAGNSPEWLAPVVLAENSPLRLYQVAHAATAPQTGNNGRLTPKENAADNPYRVNAAWRPYSQAANRLVSSTRNVNRRRASNERHRGNTATGNREAISGIRNSDAKSRPAATRQHATKARAGTARDRNDNGVRRSSLGRAKSSDRRRTARQGIVRTRGQTRQHDAGIQRVLHKGLPCGSGADARRRSVSSSDAPVTKSRMGASQSCRDVAASGRDSKPGSRMARSPDRGHVAAPRRTDVNRARQPSGRAGRRHMDDASTTAPVHNSRAQRDKRRVGPGRGQEPRRSDIVHARPRNGVESRRARPGRRADIRKPPNQTRPVRSSRQRPELAPKNSTLVRTSLSFSRPHGLPARPKRLPRPGPATTG